MNGGHDLGGMMGFGPIAPEKDEPVFHAAWERRAFALTLAMGFTGSWTLDTSRFARESIPTPTYLNSSYYQIWLAGLEKTLLQSGLVDEAEAEDLVNRKPAKSIKRQLKAEEVATALHKGGPTIREIEDGPQFKFGDTIRAANRHPTGHTRLPRYVRGRIGKVVAHHGAHVFPDTNSQGKGENPVHLYNIQFTGQELWGPDSDPNIKISLDLWEPYLEQV